MNNNASDNIESFIFKMACLISNSFERVPDGKPRKVPQRARSFHFRLTRLWFALQSIRSLKIYETISRLARPRLRLISLQSFARFRRRRLRTENRRANMDAA